MLNKARVSEHVLLSNNTFYGILVVVQKIAVLGLGLIGGSIVKRLAVQRNPSNQLDILVWNHNSHPYSDVESLGVQTFSSVEDVVKARPDLIFICTPMHVLDDIMERVANALEEGSIVIDIASIKESPRQKAEELGIAKQYVGTHPMFGNELTGWKNATAELGDGASWAVCPAMNDTSRMHASAVAKFIREHLNGQTVFCDAVDHDKAVALSSHLPHVLAYELAGIISEGTRVNTLAKQLNAGSFHGATRVAGGNTAMFESMLKENYHNILPLLEQAVTDLQELIESFTSENPYRLNKDIHHFIARSDDFRSEENAEQGKLQTHRHAGDGWVKCDCGREHWGKNGAAGIFLVKQKDGEVSEVLLQHRALWSAEGGTWGTPGGAIDLNETPRDGAIREAWEEAGVEADKIDVLGEITRDHGPWKFTNVLAVVKDGAQIDAKPQDQESLAVQWFSVSDVLEVAQRMRLEDSAENQPQNGAMRLLSAFGREVQELINQTNHLLNAKGGHE
jgi:prephenate dehydrogenase/8-oxo-dGTP pyrophosphatase MutT (NUDIX family)